MNKKIITRQNIRKIQSEYSYLVSFVILVLIALYFNHSFLSWSSIITLISNATITGVIACGMTLVIIAGMIDLSVGSIVALTAGLGILVLNRTGSIALCILFCLGMGLVLGLLNGVLTAYAGMAAFIATLATQCAYRSVITQIGQGGPFSVDRGILKSFSKIATGKLFGSLPVLVLFLIAAALLTWVLLTKTKFGCYVFATGSNEHAAILSGIDVRRVKLAIMGYVGLLCGLSSVLLASRMSSVTASNAGSGYELDCIAAVAIGGTPMSGGRGKVIGTFLGALMMQMISTILIAAKIDPFLTGLVKGIIIIVAVIFQKDDRNG